MFCPKCGASSQRDRVYCTRCGEWLPGRGGESPQRLLFVMNIFGGLGTLFSLLASVILFVVNLRPKEPNAALIVAGVFSIMIFSWQLTCLILGMVLAKRLRREHEGAGATEESAGTGRTNYLPDGSRAEAQFREARSVTENTTELFEPASVSRTREG